MASVFLVMFAMCKVPLVFTVIRWFKPRDTPLRNQVMVGAGDPETIQVRFSEALFPAASLAKTTMSWGSSLKLGGVPVTAQQQIVTNHFQHIVATTATSIDGGTLVVTWGDTLGAHAPKRFAWGVSFPGPQNLTCSGRRITQAFVVVRSVNSRRGHVRTWPSFTKPTPVSKT